MLTVRGGCARGTQLMRLRSARLGLGFRGRKSISSGGEERPSEGKRFAALWGNGDYGRLGLGGLESKWRPTFCSAFSNESLRSIACGGAHTLFLTETGCVYTSGLNDFGQLGISNDKSYATEPLKVLGLPNDIIKISAGYYHSSAITADGELYVWGKNSNGQLGLGKKAAKVVSVPNKVESLTGVAIKIVALGLEHSLAVTDKGEALSWGEGGSGRLGHGHEPSMLGFLRSTSEFTPRLIKNLEGLKIQSIAAGMLHSACIDENGCVFVFGERAMDKLGLGQAKNATRPSKIGQLPLSEEVACGGYHTCVITRGGELYTWGSNENGCLGTGCTDASHLPERVKGRFLKHAVAQVSCGWKHTAAISEGHVYAWGWGGSHGTFSEDGHSSCGQLDIEIPSCFVYSILEGQGNDVDYIMPTRVIFGRNVRALQVSCGFNHTGAILESI